MSKNNGNNQHSNSNGNVPLREYQWKPGQSGNPKGRPKGVSITGAIRELVAAGLNGKDLEKALATVAIQRALSGDYKFYQLVVERLDGKVPDMIESQGEVDILVRYADNRVND